MFKEKFIELLKSKNENTQNKQTAKAIDKIKKEKRLSSEEFQKVYDSLWKEGPAIKYQNPNAWRGSQVETA